MIRRVVKKQAVQLESINLSGKLEKCTKNVNKMCTQKLYVARGLFRIRDNLCLLTSSPVSEAEKKQAIV